MKLLATPALIAAVAAVAAVIAAAPAAHAEERRQTYSAKLTTERPGSATGLRQQIRYRNPADPAAKPHSVARVVFRLPAGSQIDTSVPPQCDASEAQFQAKGRDACPPETQVGTGGLSADTGLSAGDLPRVVETDVSFFNNHDELILFAESTNTPVPIRVASRIEVSGRELVSTVPPLPGAPPPDPFLALKDVTNSLDRIQTDDGAYITAPPRCRKGGKWTITAEFTYRDGVSQTEKASTPCRPIDRRGPRLRLRGAPDRHCVCTGFRVRARAWDPSGIRRIAVHLDGRPLRSARRDRLSAWIPARRLKAGSHRLSVTAADEAGNRMRKSLRFSRCS